MYSLQGIFAELRGGGKVRLMKGTEKPFWFAVIYSSPFDC